MKMKNLQSNHVSRWRKHATILLFTLLSFSPALSAQKKENLAKNYRDWLERDVVYIITRTEHDAFLRLSSNEERDRFIDNFWEIRNPTPEAPTNPFKEEHYKRLAYANNYFGKASGDLGWRTDMGRTYIVLGPPQQKSTYHDSQSLRPMEVWFYQNVNPALPPYFSVLFYRKDNFSEYKLYSPYFDGPQELITTRGQTRQQAWVTIDKDGNRELARLSLSLLPDEPVDTVNATTSMESDVMLAHLRDLANNPLSVEQLNLQRMRNSVSSVMIMRSGTLGVLVVPVRDSSGQSRVDYALHLSKPEDFSLAESSTNHFNFKIGIQIAVFTKDNNRIFMQEREYTRSLSEDQKRRIQNRIFGFEGSLPLPPGSYHLEFTLTDLLKKVSYREKQDVVVPDIPKDALLVTSIVPFVAVKKAEAEGRDVVPFAFGDIKFIPILKREAAYSSGNQLRFFYQIWGPKRILADAPGQKLKLKYTYGRPGGRMEAEFLEDAVDRAQFDPNGSLVNGKELPVGGWAPGNYKLILTLTDPATNQDTYSTMDFRVGSGFATPDPWGIDDREETAKEVRNGERDYQRGLCYLAAGDNDSASPALHTALDKNPGSQRALTALVDADFLRKAYPEVAKYATSVSVTDRTEERTILQLAQSLDLTGDTKNAISVLEGSLKSRKPSGPIYLTLAGYYTKQGLSDKASQYEKKGRELMLTHESQN